jgi:hypothetical protein
MDEGILEVKLVPSWNSPGIHSLLHHSIDSAELLQAGIAYWTVDDKIVGDGLARVLGHKDGFLCVDLHQPTGLWPFWE